MYVIQNSLGQNIAYSKKERRITKACDKLNSGAGFNDEVPFFFLNDKHMNGVNLDYRKR